MNIDSRAYPSQRERVAANVRAEVARKSTPQSALATALDLNQAGISRRLSGKVEFSASELALLSKLLCVPVERFFVEDTALAEGGEVA